jgi:hypothetical protein
VFGLREEQLLHTHDAIFVHFTAEGDDVLPYSNFERLHRFLPCEHTIPYLAAYSSADARPLADTHCKPLRTSDQITVPGTYDLAYTLPIGPPDSGTFAVAHGGWSDQYTYAAPHCSTIVPALTVAH